jgi:hypothetical protein
LFSWIKPSSFGASGPTGPWASDLEGGIEAVPKIHTPAAQGDQQAGRREPVALDRLPGGGMARYRSKFSWEKGNQGDTSR